MHKTTEIGLAEAFHVLATNFIINETHLTDRYNKTSYLIFKYFILKTMFNFFFSLENGDALPITGIAGGVGGSIVGLIVIIIIVVVICKRRQKEYVIKMYFP